MGKVGFNDEALLERVIFGYDDEFYRVIKCSADGNMLVSGQAGNTLSGFSSIVNDVNTLNPAPAGTTFLDGPAVGEGKAQVIHNITVRNVDTVCTVIYLKVKVGSDYVTILHLVNPILAFFHAWNGTIYVPTGGLIQGHFYGCTNGDNITFQVNGYEMNAP